MDQLNVLALPDVFCDPQDKFCDIRVVVGLWAGDLAVSNIQVGTPNARKVVSIYFANNLLVLATTGKPFYEISGRPGSISRSLSGCNCFSYLRHRPIELV